LSVVLVAIEGVLGESSVIHGFYPIPDGVKLAHALRSGYRLHFSSVQAGAEAVEHWLLINGMSQPAFYENLIVRDSRWTDLSDSMLRAEHAAHLRRTGVDLGLVVSGDPATILLVSEMGVPALLFTNPTYRWGEYRPDKKRMPKPWQDIDDEMVRQMELKAGDPRLREYEGEQV
jgi:hypothetical protein